jgi:carbonic anhydrase
MKELLASMIRFQKDVFPKQKERYAELATSQSPHTLFITCADSRLMPNDIVQAAPGELFICRNAGNIVPPYGDNLGGVSATVEYAVQVLGVKHAVICGHSDCGAMKAVVHPENVKHLRAVANWVQHAERVSDIARELHGNDNDPAFLDRVIEENVVTQLDNLITHPFVAAKVRAGQLTLHGMVFHIKTGEITILDRQSHKFVPVAELMARIEQREVANA